MNQQNKKVLESGYNFKRGLSRSKKLLDQSLDDKKWAKTSTNERKEMLTRLTKDMKLIDDKMRPTASLINKYTTVKNFEGSLKYQNEMGKLRSEKRKKEEIKIWQRKERKSENYQKRKTASSSENDSSGLKKKPKDFFGTSKKFPSSSTVTSSEMKSNSSGIPNSKAVEDSSNDLSVSSSMQADSRPTNKSDGDNSSMTKANESSYEKSSVKAGLEKRNEHDKDDKSIKDQTTDEQDF